MRQVGTILFTSTVVANTRLARGVPAVWANRIDLADVFAETPFATGTVRRAGLAGGSKRFTVELVRFPV